MDRRSFFRLLGMGVAGVALDQAIPFNRVWSFPSKIVIGRRVLYPILTSKEVLFKRLMVVQAVECGLPLMLWRDPLDPMYDPEFVARYKKLLVRRRVR